MKRMLALLIATLTLSAAHAAKNQNYTLYYLDKTRNVCSVEVSATKKLPTHPHRLTSGGGYDGYSVSPDGNQVFGCKQIGVKYDEFLVFKCYLEKSGRRQERIPGTVMADEYPPSADWSPHKKYLIVSVPGQAELSQTIIYSVERHKIVCDTMDLVPDFSGDQAYSFALQDMGDGDNDPSWLRLLDMRTGKMTKVAQVNFGVYGDPRQNVWFGKSHKFAFIDMKGNVVAGEALHSKSGPTAKKRMLTKNGGCTDLRYVPGRGIFFVQKSGNTANAYYSSDLRRLTRAAALPVGHVEPRTGSQLAGRVYSPDNRLYATVESDVPGKMGTIKVYDKSGHLVDVARGTRPRWRGGAWASQHYLTSWREL